MMRLALSAIRHTTEKRGKIWAPSGSAGTEREEKKFIPQALFLLNIKQNLPILRYSIKLQIPIIALVNSDTNSLGLRYPIPANNVSNLELYKKLVLGAIHHQNELELLSKF